MTLDDIIQKAVDEALKRVESRLVEIGKKQLELPSTRLRPELVLIETPPEGTKAYSWFNPDAYRGGRQYQDRGYNVWRASYGDIVVYGTTPANALDEFDYLVGKAH